MRCEWEACLGYRYQGFELGLGDTAKNIITIKIFTSVDIDNYHDKRQIIIPFEFKGRFFFSPE